MLLDKLHNALRSCISVITHLLKTPTRWPRIGFLAAILVLVTTVRGAAENQTSASAVAVARPGVLVTSTGLAEIRRALIHDPYRRNTYETSIKATADDWVTRSVTIPPRSGYYHDFVCTDGTRLVWPDELKHCEAIPAGQEYICPACGNTYSGEKLDGAVRYLQHTSLMAAVRNLALVGAIEEEDRYSAKAAEILSAYADAYPGRHTGVTKGGILYQSLDEAVYVIYLAQAYDLLVATDSLTSSIREHIQRNLLWECAEGLIVCGTGGNWGSWHLSAVGVIGFATGHKGYIDYGIAEFKKQITEQLGADGLWPESVHTYHFYPMRGFLQLAEAAVANGIDLYRWEAEPGRSLQAMFTQPIYYAYPNLQLPAINDGWFWSFLPLDVYELGYNRLQLPELGWVVKESRLRDTTSRSRSPDALNVWSLIHGIPVTDEMPVPNFQSTDFPTIGICTLRLGLSSDREIMLTFDYGRHLGHGQADKMGVTLFANDRLLLPDFGTPSYGSAILPYYRGTSSHNTIMIDGKNQQNTTTGTLLAFFDEPDLKAAVAETTEVAHGVTWRRGVFLTADYALVIDSLKSEVLHSYDSLLHCIADHVTFDGDPEADTDDLARSTELPHINVTSGIFGTSVGLNAAWMENGTPLLRSSHVSIPAGMVYNAVSPGEDGNTTIPCVIHRVDADTAVIATLLVPDAQKKGLLRFENGNIIVSHENGQHMYETNNDNFVIDFSEDESPGPRKINLRDR